jgi:hypothetical protein
MVNSAVARGTFIKGAGWTTGAPPNCGLAEIYQVQVVPVPIIILLEGLDEARAPPARGAWRGG